MRKFGKHLFVFTVLFISFFMLFSCVQKPSAETVSVHVNVDVPKEDKLSEFKTRIAGYVEEIEAIYLTVTNSNGHKVYESSTKNKISPSFSFSLPSAGT